MTIRHILPLALLLATACEEAAPGGSGGDESDTSVATDDVTSGDSGENYDAGCSSGELGCSCFGNDTCLGALVCQDTVCVQCELGSDGCGCFGNGTCSEGLDCDDGTCRASDTCVPGAVGCNCVDGACSDGATCQNGTCQALACPPGSEGCACDAGSCAGALECDAGVCVAPSCEVGSLGCACFPNASCGVQAGVALECIAGACQLPTCPAGSEGCACHADASCDAGLTCTGIGPVATCETPGTCPSGTAGCPCGAGGACGPGLYCNSETCDALGCTLGTVGCLCNGGLCDGPGVVCNASGWCEQAPCPIGTEGCPCASGNSCGLNTRGEVMACATGQCVAPSCEPGATGCPCAWGADCASDNASCVSGFCQPKSCAPGQEHCSCAGGSCIGELTCRDGAICVESAGLLGGPCLDDGTCFAGGKCSGDTCVACNYGSFGCACTAEGTCANGLTCWAGQCADADDPTIPPVNPVCYTPCKQSLIGADGAFLECGSDGLMTGCLASMVCNQGSCTPPGAAKPTCTSELDCPDFQTCLSGGCYSNCTLDLDCPSGQLCDRRVCRTPCTTSGDDCGAGWVCSSEDGVAGFCRLLSPPGDTPQTSVYADYALDQQTIQLSNVATTSRITITNHSPKFETFTVHKLDHTLTAADGTASTADDAAMDCTVGVDCPLYWLEVGPEGQPAVGSTVQIGVEGNGGTAVIEIAGSGNVDAARWDGRLEVTHPTFGRRVITMTYSERPEGRWNGRVYYFATFGDRELAPWVAAKDDPDTAKNVGNALIRRWSAFRQGDMSIDELKAVLLSTRTESWRWSGVKQDCPSDTGACYPYDANELGLVVYTSNLASNPIPSGVVEFPISMNLYEPDPEGSPGLMTGRIESALSLQYAGDPAVMLDFGSDPSGCEAQAQGGCLVFLDDLQANILVGGRYATTSSDVTCSEAEAGFELREVPWLVPGFIAGSEESPAGSGARYRYECRDRWLPYEPLPGEPLTEALASRNRNLALSNPVPDGRTRRRVLKLIDGALMNQSTMLILFEETFESFLPGESQPFSAYGYMMLSREPADLSPDDDDANGVPDVYQGSDPVDERAEPDALLGTSCRPELVQEALGFGETQATPENVAALVTTLLTGRNPAQSESLITAGSSESVHYLCEQLGIFDGGSGAVTEPWQALGNDDSCGFDQASDNHFDSNGSCDDGGPGSDTTICPIGTDVSDCGERSASDGDFRQACPLGSGVTWFTLPAEWTQSDVAELECQADGSCGEQLQTWLSDGTIVQLSPVWRCESPTAVFCDDDRLDLRNGKLFYAITDQAAVMEPLEALIQLAFRYRTQFVARDGDSPGFAPTVCNGDGKALPYCYDPDVIEALEDRVDCLLDAWRNHYDTLAATTGLSAGVLDELNRFLCSNFAYTEACSEVATFGQVHDGFERYVSELWVMLGDESYTRAFASRFDLVGSNPVSFEGSLFEDNGINLSGAAGYEMYSLYQATQYYSMALDRFYRLAPALWEAMGFPFSDRNFVTAETVTRYLERLVRASTQKSRAWSEVAKRYQSFNRPDLARRVIARAYTATYVESVVLARLMLALVETLKPEDRPQVQVALDQGQRRYRLAMADMQSVYADMTDEVRFFGLPADFIPFPAPPPFGTNDSAVEVMIARAKQKMDVARIREDAAIERSKAFETDEAEFQSELIRLRNTYETQLGDLCGTFIGPDEKVYPAITRYAQLDPTLARYGEPCGMAGNGVLFESMAGFEVSQLELRRIRATHDAILGEIEIERARASAQCNLILSNADFVYKQQSKINTLSSLMSSARLSISAMDRVMGFASTIAQLSKCSTGTSTDCPSGAVAAFTYGNAATALHMAALTTEAGIVLAEAKQLDMQASLARWETAQQCDMALIDSNARMATIGLRMAEVEIESLRAQYQMRLALAEIQQQMNAARRVQDELDEAQELAVNVFAARSDPNVRIYRDDAIVNAEVAFDDALREAYRTTKVLEYYTSQSYAGLEQLFLIRMVQYGEYNLQNYLLDLENTFFDFEDTYGVADQRVARLSLRDDLLDLPRLKQDGTPYDTNERVGMMRDRLRDPSLLDEQGYLTIPFRTTLEDLSPLTRVHKVDYIEAEIVGSEVGDTVARLYLRARGTGVVHGLDDEKQFFRFPERVAVINPFLNGAKIFDPAVYRTHHLRDRPFVNTAWELVINQRDEKANKDINLQSLTDVRLYVYYRDFTAL